MADEKDGTWIGFSKQTVAGELAKAALSEQKQRQEAEEASKLLELIARRKEERKAQEAAIQDLIARKVKAEDIIKKLARKKLKSKKQDEVIDGLLTQFVMGGVSGSTKSLRLKPGYKTGVSDLYLVNGKREVLLAMRTEENFGSPAFVVADLPGKLEENIKRAFVSMLRQYFKAYIFVPPDLLDMWRVRS